MGLLIRSSLLTVAGIIGIAFNVFLLNTEGGVFPIVMIVLWSFAAILNALLLWVAIVKRKKRK